MEPDSGEDWVDPPSAPREALKFQLAEAARRKWLVWSQDATRAFLQSDKKHHKKKIAIRPPKELGETGLWLLLLVLYGLRAAPAAWWLTFREALVNLGFKPCRSDPAFLILCVNKTLHGMTHVHVDDTLCSGDEIYQDR